MGAHMRAVVAKTDAQVEGLAKEKALTGRGRCYTNKCVPTVLADEENTQQWN
jgi:hypothetical protein